MPELPEVEVLVRHLRPLLRGKRIHEIEVRRGKVLRPNAPYDFKQKLLGATFTDVSRRGKYLLFKMRQARTARVFEMLGHLGMTGRMYLIPRSQSPPKHVAVMFSLGREYFVFEDTRYFGRLTLAKAAIDKLGPEPLADAFTAQVLGYALRFSKQAIKVKLLNQSLVAGIGNIYASEALYRAGISPKKPAGRLRPAQVQKLWKSIRRVLTEAIECGSTVPLNFDGAGERDGLFYFGRASGASSYYEERLQVYDRAEQSCPKCAAKIRRIVQMGRSTFYCPKCQRA